jgi:hypothetical protein
MAESKKTQDRPPDLESEGWYYTRLVLQRGRPGSLRLQGTLLSFETLPQGERPAGTYEAMDETATTIFVLDLNEIDSVSYNWLTGSMTIAHSTSRHIVSLVGPSSGSMIKDLGRLARGYAALAQWQGVLTTGASAATEAARETGQGAQR